MAIRTVSNSGGNWSTTTTWVEGAVPTASDDVVFTATSGNITVNTSAAGCRNLDFTNYVGTITFNQHIQMCGDLNLGTGGYTQAGINAAGYIGTPSDYPYGIDWDCSVARGGTGSATFYPNGVEFSRRLTCSSGTYTLAGYASLSGGFGVYSAVVNGYSISLKAPYAKLGYGNVNTGTTEIIFKNTGFFLPTGTPPSGSSSGANYLGFEKITINAPGGIVTHAGTGSLNSLRLQNNTTSTLFKIVAGTLDLMTTSTSLWISGTVTLDLGATELYSLTEQTGTFTLTGDLTINDLLVGGTATLNGYTLLIKRDFRLTTWYCVQQGTTVLKFIGTGAWTQGTPTTGQAIACTVIFDTPGTITMGATYLFPFSGATVTHVQGRIVGANWRIISSYGNTTFNLGSQVVIDYISHSSGTLTLLRDLHINELSVGSGTINGEKTYIYTSILTGTNGGLSGTSTIVIAGDDVTIDTTRTGTDLVSDVVIASRGTVKAAVAQTGAYTGRSFWRITGNCTYLYGKMVGLDVIYLNGASKTLLNFHKIPFNVLVLNILGTTNSITMNEFVTGAPGKVVTVDATGQIVALQFTDNVEKFTKFVKLINCRFSNAKQLTILTGNSGNSATPNVRLGSNQLPSGLPKNLPSVTTQVGYKENFLLEDPSLS